MYNPIELDGYVINDGQGCNYCVDGLGKFTSWENAIFAIVEDMDRSGFYPNVYYVNDHGNVDLLAIDTETMETKIVDSWV